MPKGIPKSGINKGWFKKGIPAPKTAFKKGMNPWNKNKKTGLIPKTAFKKGMVSSRKGKKYLAISGKLHWNYKDGRCLNKDYLNWQRHSLRNKRKRNAGGNHTFADWENLKAQYNWTCPHCGKSEPEIKLTEDHIIPISKGGSDNIENIQPLCLNGNRKKYTKILRYQINNK